MEYYKKPNHFKMLDFEDLIIYIEKNKPFIIEKHMLRQYGFDVEEINWLMQEKMDVINMVNEKVLLDKSEYIKQLKSKLEEMDKLYESLQEKITLASDKKECITCNCGDKNQHNNKNFYSINMKKIDYETIFMQEYRRKQDGNYYAKNSFISRKQVSTLWNILKLLTDKKNNVVGYRQVIKTLIAKYNLKISEDEFNGGNNRGRYYFKLYYNPLKVLTYYHYVKHKSNKITLLKRPNVVIIK